MTNALIGIYIGLAYLVGINLYGFIIMGIDKGRAKKDQWRISEKHLLGSAALGGSLGVLLGMKTFRHKTKHRLFQWSVPIMLVLQFGLLLYLVSKIVAL
jgi:uncharacterized membrane protein YsdA (DUF1294 family)